MREDIHNLNWEQKEVASNTAGSDRRRGLGGHKALVLALLSMLVVVGGMTGIASARHFDNTDPGQTGCSRTGRSAAVVGKYIDGDWVSAEMRWSNGCHTNWTRVTTRGDLKFSAWVMRLSDSTRLNEPISRTGWVWTNQLAAGRNETVCGGAHAYRKRWWGYQHVGHIRVCA